MDEKLGIIVRVRYIQDGMIRTCYGEIQKTKIEEIQEETNPFMLIKNDRDATLIEKLSILAIDELGTSSGLYEKIIHADGKISLYRT